METRGVVENSLVENTGFKCEKMGSNWKTQGLIEMGEPFFRQNISFRHQNQKSKFCYMKINSGSRRVPCI